ncbi:protein kinase domain-containing protein [Tengunoibacter tsumagoiensis]|uniref:non-specific serine/threonine protein kinase n=1 Tax=Tengunoibacter tsumagoiensis TaxID=2014871 RepID=A0A402A2C8_9CHLR|nr:protein kinase [Tengunoibacter tsumagoiensis]GCE13297.1 hypothetical protein KTT_31560 [Tengunoibacter tsumagoiensis]
MPTLSADQLVGQSLGNYQLERLLGRGRLNAIYLARHRTLQRSDALTFYLLPEHYTLDARQRFLARFHQEAQAVTQLDHPHILPVYEVGEYAGFPYLVTPYMMNGSLADLLKQKGRYEYDELGPIVEQIISGLAYAHSKGFIHGTLKPANIVVSNEGILQVAGFGLMHILQASGIEPADQPYAHLLSIVGTFLAAPEYIAPEVVQGQSIDRRSDMYALGCIIYELLSGRPPFTGQHPLEVAEQHLKQSIPPLHTLSPTVPLVLESVINQTLIKDPLHRFQQVEAFGVAFQQATRGASSSLAFVDPIHMPVSQTVQETPQSGYVTRNWQLMPPIVTGKLPIVSSPSANSSRERFTDLSLKASSGRLPASAHLKPPVPAAPPTLIPLPPQELANAQMGLVKPLGAASMAAKPQTVPEPAVVKEPQPADLAKAYEWWSQPGLAPADSSPSARASAPKEASGLAAAQWTSEPVRPLPSSARQMPPPTKSSPSRRRVVALLAGGGVIAAGLGVAALNLNHFMGSTGKQQAVTPLNSNGQGIAQRPPAGNQPPAGKNPPPPAGNQPPAGNPPPVGNQPPAGNPPPTAAPAPGHTGTVIGQSTQPTATATTFVNPADKKNSLLIHLTNGNFAAYEMACTHEGVAVRYDKGTGTLVCPAHGAVFDPMNAGKVLQGPATRPLPSVAIKVNADGTVTAV